nr:reverse transcriptase domain-containing protein [Tanacetum cinerariifolium]
MMSSPKVAGRLLKWRFELEGHEIHYRPRTSVKGQIIADLIVERPKEDLLDTPMKNNEELQDPWILFTDGSSCIDGSGAGLIITNPKGMEFTYALRFRFHATNNEAKYEALIASLRIAEQIGVKICKRIKRAASVATMQDNAKENCMVSFQLLHSQLTALSNNDSKGTCIKGGFERAFVALFDQDIQTFTCSMLLNLDQLEKQLDKEEFQETGSTDAFRALMTQFQTNCQKESYGSNDMAHNYYLEEAKKKTQDKNRNLKPKEMPSAKTHHTPNACTQKPKSNNQTSRNWPASKSCEETLKAGWISTGRIFNTAGLKWVLTGKTFTSSTTKVDSEPPNGSNDYITNPNKCDQTLNVNVVPTEMELILEQTQQGISHEVSLLPIIAKKVHQEKVQQEKLKAVKARLNFEHASQYSESGTPSRRRSLKEMIRSRHVYNKSGNPKPRRDHSKLPRKKGPERRTMFKRLEKGVFHRLIDKKKKSIPRELPPAEKCIKDPVKIHNIRQRDGESMEEFVRRYKIECSEVKGAPECMKISRFMHRITNPELIKRLHDKIPKSVDEMMRVTTIFLRGEVAASTRERKKSFSSWKQQEAGQKQNFMKGGFQNQQRSKRRQDMFTFLTKTPKEIMALDKGKFKPHPPMTTLVEKRNASKFYEFHREVGHTTDECIHLKRQIEEMLKAGKLTHLIKKLKQSNGKDQEKAEKEGNLKKGKTTSNTDGEEDGMEGPMIIKAEIGGHFVHCMTRNAAAHNQVTKEKIQVAIHHEYPEQTIAIGSSLTKEGWKELCCRLRRNHDIFAWKPSDMTGVLRHIVEHSLYICEGCPPVRQKKRWKAPERNKAIYEEVEKLVDDGIMKEVHYHSWLSNPVLVKKAGRQLENMCGFQGLKKACLKDGYPLLEIDWKVESLCRIFYVNRTERKRRISHQPGGHQRSRSAVLMTKRNGKQMLIYFVSRALQGPEINYTLMEKLILAVMLSSPEVAGRLLKWRFELEDRLKDNLLDTPMKNKEELLDLWILFIDESSCVDGFRAEANDLVERENRSLGKGIKARLDERIKNWMKEISHVLWAHRTKIKSNNGETPFSLTYGTEAMIPAAIQEAKSKVMMEKYYNTRVRNTSFRPGDLIYQCNEASHAEEGGKLGPKWEGRYEVTKALGKGSYKLRHCNRNILPRT